MRVKFFSSFFFSFLTDLYRGRLNGLIPYGGPEGPPLSELEPAPLKRRLARRLLQPVVCQRSLFPLPCFDARNNHEECMIKSPKKLRTDLQPAESFCSTKFQKPPKNTETHSRIGKTPCSMVSECVPLRLTLEPAGFTQRKSFEIRSRSVQCKEALTLSGNHP